MQILFPDLLLPHNFEIIILQKLPIQYISHGQFETGGYKLETALCEALGGATEVRFRRNFKGIFGWFSLAIKAFFNAKSDVVITVSRLAWPVYARQLFSKRKMVVVLHNLDETDGKPKLYFHLLKLFIQKAAKKPNKIAIICVADFWKNRLETKYKFENNIFVFPNLFSTPKYQFYADVVKKNESLIHLGQYSEKADFRAYRELVHVLKSMGFQPYFSSNIEQEIHDFPVSYFQTHEAYLKQMALAKVTIILNKVAEGWNRVAHESFLVGTQVISNGGGGLQELVQWANGYLISDLNEIKSILEQELKPINYKNLEQFDQSNCGDFVTPIKTWIQS